MIKNNDLPQFNLTNEQVTDFARPLAGIIAEFYKDPENEKKFQEWLGRQASKPKDNVK